jgi:hypothetical protein
MGIDKAKPDAAVTSSDVGIPPSREGHASTQQPHPWKIAVNEKYQKVIDLLISLSTASLILPPIFLQKFLGITDDPLLIHMDAWAFTSIGCFGLSVLFGIVFHWISAKWIKHAWGQPTWWSERALERTLDSLFLASTGAFLSGIATFVAFILRT